MFQDLFHITITTLVRSSIALISSTLLLSILITPKPLYAECVCIAEIQKSAEDIKKNVVDDNFNKIKDELQRTEDFFKEETTRLTDQNTELDKKIALAKETILELKRWAFLLKSDIDKAKNQQLENVVPKK